MKSKPIVIFSSDDNPDYCEFENLVTSMWIDLGFEPFFAKIGSEQFPLIDGVESSLQAQIVRLYATKMFPNRIVMTTDIDMLPFDQNYYISKLVSDYNQISVYSYDAHNGKRYPMCYISAYGKTFSEIVLDNEDETWEDFVLRLNSLGFGWNTDELYLTARINESKFEVIKYNRGWKNGIAKNRLDRVNWNASSDFYIDAHCPRPYSQNKNQIDKLLPLVRKNYKTIQPFIFNWNGQFEKTCQIEKELTKIFDKVVVINSDDNNTKDNWINLGNDAYFSDQFRKALELFDADILMHVQGDVEYDDWCRLVHDARQYMDYYNAGIYAPNIDYSWYSSENTDIESIVADHSNIKMVSCTDETVWFINKEVINEFYNKHINFSSNKMGWGWDLVFASICFTNAWPVVRDYNHTIKHPKGTNYDKNIAAKELKEVWLSLDDDLKNAFSLIKGSKNDRESLSKYFE